MDPITTVHLPAKEVKGGLKVGETVVLRGKVANVGDEISIDVTSVDRVKVLASKPRGTSSKPVSTLEYLKKVNPEPITPVPSLV